MPRVLIIFSGAGLIMHLNEGAKHRLNCYINCYKEAGYEVDVLCLFKDLSYWKSLKKYVDNSVHWIFVPYLFPRTKNKPLALLLRYYKYLVGWLYSTIKHYDVVQSEVDGLPLRFIGDSSMRITDFHGDGYYEYTSKPTHKKWCSDNFLFDQVCSIKYSDVCITVSENLCKQLEKNTDTKIATNSIISCGVNTELYNCNAYEGDLMKLTENRIVLGYCGGLQVWQNIELIVDLAIKLYKQDNRIFLVIYTGFDISANLQKQLDALGVENYYIKDLLPAEVPSYLKLLDAGFLLRDDLVLNTVSSPTKICEYLAAGVPMICTEYSGDYARSVRHGKEGFVLKNHPNYDFHTITELLIYLKEVKTNRADYKKMCEMAASKRTFKSEFSLLDQLIRKGVKNV
ncbi:MULTISPECIES: glycosyltransferase [Bacteroides]|uniref:glycosyltransferase n=1 Tax=Bacteroides TaxID=816 RepID=UPI000E43A4A2|nr:MULTISPECIES: glycosyltransferase [Bacteroides]MBS7575797.1 glycosyltransferase [Bacteroides propionicigenes]RGM27110.1 glycosyltransferase [Bacteroides sp. OM08-17BH]HBO05943.1 glycosyl transferase group 1 [Bacteroides sp.]